MRTAIVVLGAAHTREDMVASCMVAPHRVHRGACDDRDVVAAAATTMENSHDDDDVAIVMHGPGKRIEIIARAIENLDPEKNARFVVFSSGRILKYVRAVSWLVGGDGGARGARGWAVRRRGCAIVGFAACRAHAIPRVLPREQVEPWIAETQATLGALIKRPKLTVPLLSKPPFRFLHDIVSEVTKVTSFAEGLYDEMESNSSNIKVGAAAAAAAARRARAQCVYSWRDRCSVALAGPARAQDKDSKIAYLQKITDCVSFALGTKIDVRPSKVVAGMEPQATNLLLQALAAAATDPNIDRAAAVARVLSGESTAPKAAPKLKERPPPDPVADTAAAAAPPPPMPPPPRPAVPEPPAPPPVGGGATAPPPASAAGSAAAPLSTFTSEMPSADDGAGGGGAQKAERPRTARRAPPKVANNTVKVEHALPRGEETSTAKNIISEGAMGDGDDDDDDGIVIVDGTAAEDASAAAALLKDASGTGHTKIVKDILETQKEMEAAGREDERAGTEAERAAGGGGIILGKKGKGGRDGGGDRQRSKDEIQKLRADIQALCQSTNPLGKSLEFVHEVRDARRARGARDTMLTRGAPHHVRAGRCAGSRGDDARARALAQHAQQAQVEAAGRELRDRLGRRAARGVARGRGQADR